MPWTFKKAILIKISFNTLLSDIAFSSYKAKSKDCAEPEVLNLKEGVGKQSPCVGEGAELVCVFCNHCILLYKKKGRFLFQFSFIINSDNLKKWEELAAMGDEKSQVLLGEYYLKLADSGTDEDRQRYGKIGVSWLIEASKQGDDKADELLKKCLQTKTGKIKHYF